MSFENLEQLEHRVDRVLRELHALQGEKKILAEEIQALRREHQILKSDHEKKQAQTSEIKSLEKSKKRMEEERVVIRQKIERLLKGLDQLDFV